MYGDRGDGSEEDYNQIYGRMQANNVNRIGGQAG